jgi:RHS repeat-associated protein
MHTFIYDCTPHYVRVCVLSTSRSSGKERDTESGLDYFGARYMASTMGRFMSPDPSRLSISFANPQTWNRYSYVYNNPLSLRDDNGKWPTQVHNDIIDKAFPNLSPEQRQILKNVSASQDGILNGGQSEGNSSEHAMSSDSESPSDAFNEFSSFVSNQEELAQDAQQQFWLSDPDAASKTISPEALAAFGKALHAYTDSTSPSHQGFQRWRWYNIPGVLYHKWQERKPSDVQMQNAINIARRAFLTTFGVDIQDAGDGATVTTSQGDGIPCGGNTGNPCQQ